MALPPNELLRVLELYRQGAQSVAKAHELVTLTSMEDKMGAPFDPKAGIGPQLEVLRAQRAHMTEASEIYASVVANLDEVISIFERYYPGA